MATYTATAAPAKPPPQAVAPPPLTPEEQKAAEKAARKAACKRAALAAASRDRRRARIAEQLRAAGLFAEIEAAVAQLAPAGEPWPLGCHRTIAAQLGLPPSVVHAALGAIRAKLVAEGRWVERPSGPLAAAPAAAATLSPPALATPRRTRPDTTA